LSLKRTRWKASASVGEFKHSPDEEICDQEFEGADLGGIKSGTSEGARSNEKLPFVKDGALWWKVGLGN